MLKRVFSEKIGIDARVAFINIVLVVNAFTWYFYAYNVLKDIVSLGDVEPLLFWGINFVGMAVSAILGATIIDRFRCRVPFLLSWMFTGVIFSFTPLVVNFTSMSVLTVPAIFGVYFGLGMPVCMGYYADSTVVENRSRLGGITFFFIGLGFFLLGGIGVSDIAINALILATWRGAGLLILLFLKVDEKPVEKRDQTSYSLILSNQQFFLYFIPWCMFSMVNSMVGPVLGKFFEQGEDFVELSSIIENILVGVFAVVGGFFADVFGRKRVAIIGFAMLGLGYAILGLSSGNMLSWYFYTFVDGIAWGAFATIFLLSLWGDLAHTQSSEKYYAIGGLPFLFSTFMRLSIGSFLADNVVGKEMIFSFASFFLFLAVLPLVYAPETLPEKKIRERELKQYIEKAKKAKGKYA